MQQYFQHFPLTDYRFAGGQKRIVDFFKRIAIRKSVFSESGLFRTYFVQEGDTPDIIASKVYGDPGLYWLVLMSNNIIDYFSEWPMTSSSFSEYLQKKYPNTLLFLESDEDIGVNNYIAGETVTLDDVVTATVVDWNPTFQRLTISSELESEPTNVVGDDSETTMTVGRWITDEAAGVHHFEEDILDDDLGLTVLESVILDPRDYIAGYISGSSDKVVTNQLYEERLNDTRKEINILQPFLAQEAAKYIQSMTNIFGGPRGEIL